MNAPKWKEYGSWDEIKFLCENSDLTICGFVYNRIKMIISKHNEKITLNIDYTDNTAELIINNLPENVDNLIMTIRGTVETHKLEKIFKNLPFNLKELKFIYKESKISEISVAQSNCKFNMLFNIKIPFNCDFIVNYDDADYEVKYIDYENELELKSLEKTFIIKYQNIGSYLTGNPQITFYKFKYQRHTNFSVENVV